jgi:hypothetical protein
MNIIINILGVLVSLATFSGQAIAVTYPTHYVDSVSGSDSNSGTSLDNAWKTLSKVESASLSPGDFVAFKRGGVWRGHTFKPQSGAVDNPITYGAYGYGDMPRITKAVLLADSKWIKAAGSEWYYRVGLNSGNILLLKNTNRLAGKRTDSKRRKPAAPVRGSLKEGEWFYHKASRTIYYRDFGSGKPNGIEYSAGWKQTVSMTRTHDVILQDLNIYGGAEHVFRIAKSSYNIIVRNCKLHAGERGVAIMEKSRNILFENNDTFDITWKGYSVKKGSSQVTIKGNKVHDIGRLPTDDGDWEGITIGNGFTPQAHHNYVLNNEIYDIGQDAYKNVVGGSSVMMSAGIVIDAVTDVVVTGNIIHHTQRYGIQMLASGATARNIKIYNNLIYRILGVTDLDWATAGINPGARNGYDMYNVFIYNNTIANSNFYVAGGAGGAFHINGATAKNLQIFNNIIHAKDGYLMRGHIGSGTNSMDNNLFYKGSGNAISMGGIYAHDKIIGNSGGFWNFDYGHNDNSISRAPLFVDADNDDYRLASGSPAINAGVNKAWMNRSRDINGNKIRGDVDIGAFEKQ